MAELGINASEIVRLEDDINLSAWARDNRSPEWG